MSSMQSPTRPTRRAAASRRKAVVESSDEEDVQVKEDSEEEFTPAPRSTRLSIRQRTSINTATPKTSTRRRTRLAESVEPSEILTPGQDSTPTPAPEPSKKASPKKRVGRPSIRANRKSRASIAPTEVSEITEIPEVPQLPTPEATQSPEPQSEVAASPQSAKIQSPEDRDSPAVKPPSRNGTPLADITEQTINEASSPIQEKARPDVTMIDARTTKLEKPMDIFARTRQAGVPAVKEAETGPKARLVITYLVLINFKSYAGRQEVGPFHASFSSVVGPNGSGKSNVIDSLLFVFGFRASKMRQGKLSALIHNSAQHPNLDHCEVEVHFQEVMDLPTGGSEVIPNSTLIISRRAFKNNSSNYYINNKTSNFTTVTTLLRDRGIDLDHKRFLILQGEVESIAQMKPKAGNEHEDGLLEYLEDIIGTSKYKTPIEEAAKETEELNDVCREKNDRVKHVESEKNSLEEKKDKALAYIKDENALRFKQSALYQINAQGCKDNLEVSEEAAGKLQESLDAELSKHKDSEQEIKSLEKQYKVSSKQFDALEKQTAAIVSEINKTAKEGVKLEEKKKFLANKTKKLESTLESSKFGIREAETLVNQYGADIERNAGEIEDIEGRIETEEQELATIREGLQGKTQGLSDEIAAKQKSLEPWNEKLNVKQSAMAVAQSELEILREKGNAGAVASAELEAKLESLAEAKAAKETELEECKEEKASVLKQIERVNAQLADLSKKEPKIRSTLSDARQKADEARASLSASQTQGAVLTGLMRLKDSGRISGFHGRLGNLGAIDAKYDVAISTACPSLDNMVVDSVEVGQQCIDYLRKNNLGRANFILLDRLAQRDLSSPQTPENVPRLFDLVKSKDAKFRPAFFSVLQNTLVANDLEQANRIAYGAKRWRVVTLDGQLIDKSGTMSGGGTRVAKGGMSSKLAADVSKDTVSKLEVDRDGLEAKFREFLGQQTELNDTLSEMSARVPALEKQAQMISLEIGSVEKNMADAKRRLTEVAGEQKDSKTDKARIAALEKTIAAAEQEVSKLHGEMAGVEEEIKALQDKIMEIGGVRLRTQKAKVDGLKQQVDTLNEEMSSCQVNRSKAEKAKQKHEKAGKDATKELEKISADTEKLEADISAHSQTSSGSQQEVSEAQDALETKKEELLALKAELDAKTSEINESRGVEIDIRNRLEEALKSLSETQRKLAHWEERINKTVIQPLSDYGEPPSEQDQLPAYSRDELLDMDKDDLKHEIAALETKLENVKVDLNVLAEYRRRVEEHASRSADLHTAVASRDTAKKRCDELRRLRLEGFMEGFSIISMRLKEMYQMITMGGNAELELVDSLDPFSEGILFSVMPPKKSWKNISNLSGGEKTLSSLALVFALHHYKPTPLYVMDEIDAALDFRNVSIVASYIKERTKNAQFIVISLRNNMFELAARLVGVYKVNHMTKSVTIENRDYLVPQQQAVAGAT
ncbi:condensin subunit Cut3 [Microthyrium microscopicum]|uniref:Structural maintenance of chromosomes protein n=1 Tax=Microthyrium microscopicum TaxID=703497 RepID=A0A6A6TYV4_9PEZI|nr:condensin subunit Cut3 [Microthyrium microscopicum]